MADESQPCTSTDIDEVLSPRSERVSSNATIERYLKAIADSATLNAATFKTMAEAATAKAPKKRKTKRPKQTQLESESSDSDGCPVPKRLKVPKSSARSSAYPRGQYKEACPLAAEDPRMPVRPRGLIEGSCHYNLSPVTKSLTHTHSGAPKNYLAKGSSVINPSKGKSVNPVQPQYSTDDHDPFVHEEEASALGGWEQAIYNEDSMCHESIGEPEEVFPIIGGTAPPNWQPDDPVLQWFLKVADIDVKGEDFASIKEQFKHSEELSDHFTPPKLPEPLWRNILASSQSQAYRHKSIFVAQDYLFTAIKPLLSLLAETTNPEARNKITTSIQLICSSNLQLNRFRRATSALSINHDVRKSMMALPVKHNQLFGPDFTKSVEEAVKLQASTQKAIVPYKPNPGYQRPQGQHATYRSQYQPTPYRGSNRPGPSSSQPTRGYSSRGYTRPFFRSQPFRSRGKARGRGNPRPYH